MCLEAYNIREARIHIRHLRDILRSLDISDAVNGIEFSSFSCLPAITCMDEVKRARPLDVKDEINCLPSEHLLPGAKDIYLESVIPVSSEKKCCLLKNIAFSLFNPPPGPRKMKVSIYFA